MASVYLVVYEGNIVEATVFFTREAALSGARSGMIFTIEEVNEPEMTQEQIKIELDKTFEDPTYVTPTKQTFH